MSASTLSGAFAAACVLLLAASGTFYVLMGVAVQRSGTAIQLLSVSFDPRKRFAIAARVLREYKRLCEERGRSPLLHLLLWVSVLLAIGCAAASFVVLAVWK